MSKIHQTKPTTKTLHRVCDVEVEDGEAALYRVERTNDRVFAGYDSWFIIHGVRETRHTENLAPFRPTSTVRYHAWSVKNGTTDQIESDPLPNMVEEEDIPAPGMDSAARKYMMKQ